jgi:electron transport complex protein RnfG
VSDVELTISGSRQDPSSFRLVGTLAVAAMLSGAVLASVFQVTKPVIDANKARELREGVFKVVPGSERLRRFEARDGALVPVAEGELATGPVIHAGYDAEGRFRGWAIAGEGPGFQDTIRVLYGLDPARRRVTGMHILQSRETPGLGDKIFKDEAWVASFGDLAAEPAIAVVKDGRDAEHEVDAITGATISSKAVVKIINDANAEWWPRLPAPGAEPPPASDEAGEGP